MRIFGWKSIVIVILFPILFYLIGALAGNKNRQDIVSFLAILFVFALVIGVLFYKIIKVTKDSIIIISILNPLKKAIKLPLQDVAKVVIKRNSYGGPATIDFFSANKDVSIMLMLLKSEQGKLESCLISYKIVVEVYNM